MRPSPHALAQKYGALRVHGLPNGGEEHFFLVQEDAQAFFEEMRRERMRCGCPTFYAGRDRWAVRHAGKDQI